MLSMGFRNSVNGVLDFYEKVINKNKVFDEESYLNLQTALYAAYLGSKEDGSDLLEVEKVLSLYGEIHNTFVFKKSLLGNGYSCTNRTNALIKISDLRKFLK